MPLAATAPAAAWDASPAVKMEGYLEKKGKMRVVAMWKRYWFVLEGRLLLYYKSQQEYARLSPCRGSLNMGLASCVRPGAGPDHHVLEVVLRSHVVSLRAKDRACQEQWLKALLDSMASSPASTASAGKDNGKGHGQGHGPLHFRYPSADNLSKAELQESIPDAQDGASAPRTEKRHTLPNWRRTPSTEPQLAQLGTVLERTLGSTPDATLDGVSEAMHGVRVAPRKGQGRQIGKTAGASSGVVNLARQGSILPILGKRDKAAVHPVNGKGNGVDVSPFGGQRYSFHGFRKQAEDGEDGDGGEAGSGIKTTKPKNLKSLESVLKKQLSFSSPSSAPDTPGTPCTPCTSGTPCTPGTPAVVDVLKTTNSGTGETVSASCKHCRGEGESCRCQNTSTPIMEADKENMMRWGSAQHGEKKYQPDENQNRLFRDSSFDLKRMNASLGRKHSGSEKDLLGASGVDLSFVTSDGQEFPKPVRCTSADQLWSPPRRKGKEIYVKQGKFDQLGSDAQYFSASDIHHPTHTLESQRSEPVESEKRKLVKMSVRQRLLHGNGEYIKYSEPEDCDKRDSTLNTTADSHQIDMKTKPKIRMRKRKGSNSKESYNLGDSIDGGKKRAPVRNRLSFLTRVLSHVRRTKSEDVMDHPEIVGDFSDDAFLSPHPDLLNKISTPVSRMLEDVKKMENTPNGSNPLRTNFQLGPSNSVFDEAPEEPPPDYDSVGVEQLVSSDEPPQLPPRRMKRPRSPWHDVPTNNSPVIDLDNDARQRLLSAAKYGRVIGTRTSHSMEFYDWSDPHPSDNSAQHHAYEVVSDDTSPAGSNEHLAIYLSSESSDDEFHEDVVLRRNVQDREFLFGPQSEKNPFGIVANSSLMEPLTISTDLLPMLDSSGRVGLSHVESMKLNLLMQAQKTSAESFRRQRQERIKQDYSKTSSSNDVVDDFPEISGSECLQQPPEEFADEEYTPQKSVEETTERVMDNVKEMLAPVKKLLDSCESTSKDDKIEKVTQVKNPKIIEASESKEIQDVPPQLPTKKIRGAWTWKCDNDEFDKGHSDELNDLLTQLAEMTTAPLLPAGAACSLQLNEADPASMTPRVDQKQSLSLDAVANMYDSEPDYDIPRPHVSLFHILPQSGRPFPNCRPDDDDIVVEATHFFSRPESPSVCRLGIMEDQSLNGHMSPDSLDFPFMSKRSSNWDPCCSSGRQDPKTRVKKDRNRRATLNGPITRQPFESAMVFLPPPLIRRNSMELPAAETTSGIGKGVKERGATEPKQIKNLSLFETTTCEHNSSPLSSLGKNYSPCHGELCQKHEIISSLEDISEKSELNSDCVALRPEVNSGNQARTAKPDELDLDSLETSELKKVDLPELIMSTLVAIKEEPDVLSERSDFHTDDIEGHSSGSTSEGAVIVGGSSSSMDQQTSHSTDTDLEMLSDDELGQSRGLKVVYDCMGRVMEPDSLLPEQSSEIVDLLDKRQYADNDSTKDASLETDSLELKK